MDNRKNENTAVSKFGAESPPLWSNDFLGKLPSVFAYSEIKSKLLLKPKVLEVGFFAGNYARTLRQKNCESNSSKVNVEMIRVIQQLMQTLNLAW